MAYKLRLLLTLLLHYYTTTLLHYYTTTLLPLLKGFPFKRPRCGPLLLCWFVGSLAFFLVFGYPNNVNRLIVCVLLIQSALSLDLCLRPAFGFQSA